MAEAAARRDVRLWVEFAAFYALAPAALFVALPYVNLYAAIAATMALGLVLLHVTPGWRWRHLWDLRSLRGTGRTILWTSALTAVVLTALTLWLIPERFLILPRQRTELWLGILALYPWFSVLGQEVIFRPLFWFRYGHLFPSGRARILVNATVFGAAHLFFLNWIAPLATFAGGLLFAWAYERSRSFPMVFLMHWIAGGLVFTLGLGLFFYHGAIPR